MTLRFDTSQRFCTGWGDIATGERFACPDHNAVDSKYEQCPACQKRTGFNPAFYHATSVSEQQEARNLEPHILYLAHFASGTVKVGISYAARGNSRLLEQGARSALILDTFPTAHIARQYEAKIAKLAGIAETIQLRKKISSLSEPYDKEKAAKELLETRSRIEAALGTTFTKNHVRSFDALFFPTGMPDLKHANDLTEQNLISGKIIGALGSLFFSQQQHEIFFLPMKKYVGYSAKLSYDEIPLAAPARQTSLF